MKDTRAIRINPKDNPRYTKDFTKLVKQAKKMGKTDAEAVKSAQTLMDYYSHHYQWVYLDER